METKHHMGVVNQSHGHTVSDIVNIYIYITLMNPISLALLRKHCLQQLRAYFLINPCEFPHTRLHTNQQNILLDLSINQQPNDHIYTCATYSQ